MIILNSNNVSFKYNLYISNIFNGDRNHKFGTVVRAS